MVEYSKSVDFKDGYAYNYVEDLSKIELKGGVKMSSEEIFEKVREIISDKLGVEIDDIDLSSELTEDLGADSLDLVDLVMAFEDEFGIKVDDEQIEGISTVGDIVNYIAKVIGAEDEE